MKISRHRGDIPHPEYGHCAPNLVYARCNHQDHGRKDGWKSHASVRWMQRKFAGLWRGA